MLAIEKTRFIYIYHFSLFGIVFMIAKVYYNEDCMSANCIWFKSSDMSVLLVKLRGRG